jgi:hypothetical protein
MYWNQGLGLISGMSPPGSKRKPTIFKVHRPVSPDDVRMLEIERERRQASDTRTPAQKWLGDPEPNRSALAQRKQT